MKTRATSGLLLLLLSACAVACRFEPRGDEAVDARLGPPSGMAGRPATGGAPPMGTSGTADGPPPTAPSTDGPGPAPTPDPATSTCPAGFHLCGTTCVDSTSPSTCGVACEPCPTISGGTATCDGTRCAVSCPPGQKPCLDACVAEAAPCDNTCTDGKNLCSDICVAPTSLSACGSSCSPCPSSPDGVSTCDGDKCDLRCNPGFHRCGDACLADDKPTSCGTSCTPCPVPTGGHATCDGTRCGAACPAGSKLCAGACIPNNQSCNGTCPSGQRDCNGTCVPLNDVNFCGPTCMPCRPQENADVRCEASGCVYTCRTGFHRCGDVCKDSRSVDSCGDRCDRCPAPANATASCNGASCSFACNASTYPCGDACIPRTQSCNGACPPGLRACGGSCVEGNCCSDNDCGACNTCQGNRCTATTSGQPGPQCAGTTCSGDTLTRKVCQSGQCSDATSGCNGFGCDGSSCRMCQGTCVLGTTKCGVVGVQECISQNGCPVWGPERPCPSNCRQSGSSASCCGDGIVGGNERCDAGPSGRTDLGTCNPECSGFYEKKYIKHTREAYPGNLGGPRGADRLCQAKFGDMYKALLVGGGRRATVTPLRGDGQMDWVLRKYTHYFNEAEALIWQTNDIALLGVRDGRRMNLYADVFTVDVGVTYPWGGYDSEWLTVPERPSDFSGTCMGWSTSTFDASGNFPFPDLRLAAAEPCSSTCALLCVEQ